MVMTDAQKVAEYDRLVALLKDRIDLERHYRQEGFPGSTIDQVCIDAYRAVLELIFGDDLRRSLEKKVPA